MEQTNLKKSFVLKIITFELQTTNSHHPVLGICDWQSVCCETPLRFNASLKEIFSKSKSLRGMKKKDESALMPILQEFSTL